MGTGDGDPNVARRIECGLDLGVVVVGQHDHDATACSHLIDVAEDLFEDVIARRQGDHWDVLVDEGDRSVLHLAGWVAFRVNVGDLLEFESSLERDRVIDAASEVQEIGLPVEALRHGLDQRFALEGSFE